MKNSKDWNGTRTGQKSGETGQIQTTQMVGGQNGIDLEETLIGCIIYNPNIFKSVKASSDDFENPKLRKIYEIMGKFHEDGTMIEPTLISLEMKDKTVVPYLIDLHSKIITEKIYPGIDRQIRDRSAKRLADLFSQRIIQMSRNGSHAEDIADKIHELNRLVTEKLSGRKTLVSLIDEWLNSTKGTFFVTEMDKELGIGTKGDRENRKKIMQRLLSKGKLVKASQRQGHYRIVDRSVEAINFLEANAHEDFEIRWPFDIQNLVRLLPKSIIIVAGAWEAGKTAFLLNVARMNMHKHHVRYMSSEMGDAEFRLRLDLFSEMAPEDWKIEVIERSSDWEDVILPDDINIIDYLEQSDAFYNVGDKIRKIFDRLKKGVAIIALQKATGKDLAHGGDFTAEKARLYLRLDQGELEIMKGKLWANPQISPKNMMMKFKLWQGHKFVAQGDWFKNIKQRGWEDG